MDSPRKTIFVLRNRLGAEEGIILMAALALLAALTLIGATAFFASSTNVKVGGNYQNYETALQVAMAGERLARIAPTSAKSLRRVSAQTVCSTATLPRRTI